MIGLNKNNQKGSTMIEALGVLTIIVMLGVSSIKLIGNIMGMFKQSLVTSEIRDLQKAISERYRFEGNYKSLLEGKTSDQIVKYLCDEKIAPNQMCANDKMYHRMGGPVWVMPIVDYDASGNAVSDYSKYAVTFWNLTDRACVNVAEINWHNKDRSDIYKLIINSGKTFQKTFDLPQNLYEGSLSFPVSVSEAMKGCKNDDSNNVEWVFF
ncbi:MAG: hypothetical protein E7017_04380 [Alphaproteobacteria bacterium]|nr:hypothetical protein [Alphaproteobacteria bacterium]